MAGHSSTALIAYVASPHAGYLRLFRAYEGAHLYILGGEFIREHDALRRHMPGNDPYDAMVMIEALGIFSSVSLADAGSFPLILGSHRTIVMPDEDVSRAVARLWMPNRQVYFDGSWRLRWDWGRATANVEPEPDGLVSVAELDRRFMRKAQGVAERSPDWWRKVGGVLVRDGEVLLTAYNEHVPHEQSLYLEGDPRSNFGPGEHIEVSGAIHAEAAIIARIASMERGSTKGCDLYITTFPCPPCAAAVAYAGIHRLYYAGGYSLVAGAEVLRSRGVELIRVLFDDPLPLR